MYLWAGLMAVFISGTVFSLMLEGSDPLLTTTTSIDVPRGALGIPVTSLNGWPDSGSFFLDAEEITYSAVARTAPNIDCLVGYIVGGLPLSGDFNDIQPPCFLLDAAPDGRAQNRSDEVAHRSGALVVSQTLGLIGSAVNFNLPQVTGVGSALNFAWASVTLVARSIPKMIMWDYSFLEGNGFWIKLFLLYPLSFFTVMSMIQLLRK